jgi:hypothetical protein
VKALITLLALLALLALLSLAPPVALAVNVQQPLAIVVHGDGAQATQLPSYDPTSAISVTVKNVGSRADAITIIAVGPTGHRLDRLLHRTSSEIFGGMLTLYEQGTWSVRLTSTYRNIRTTTTPITLEVQAPPPSDAWEIGLGVGSAVFLIVGMPGFVLLNHASAPRRAMKIGRTGESLALPQRGAERRDAIGHDMESDAD